MGTSSSFRTSSSHKNFEWLFFKQCFNTKFYSKFAHRSKNGERIVSSISQLNLVENIVFYQCLVVPDALRCIFMLSIASCFRLGIKCSCKVLQHNFSFVPDLKPDFLQSIFRFESNVSRKVSSDLHVMFCEWTEWCPPSMRFHEVWKPYLWIDGVISTFYDVSWILNVMAIPWLIIRQSDIQLYLMGTFSWCQFFANFVGVTLVADNIAADFIDC